MSRRLNIVLPEETVRVLDRVAPRGNRSRVISEAVLDYVTRRAKRNLATQLKRGALANAQRDLEIAQEWFPVDEEAWRPTNRGARRKK
jgi:CopG family transcriptional regulator/antitoxin EndoAI